MKVLTISRQLGSQGTTLGRMIAPRLGYRVVQRELINQAAKLVDSPKMALATIDELGLFGIEPDDSEQQAYLDAVKNVVLELAEKGGVIIVGRAGQVILRDYPGAFHLRVVAPMEERVQRVVNAHQISAQAARAQVQDSDLYRADYLVRYYKVDWNDASLYHLVINTGRIDLATAVNLVCTAAAKDPDFTSNEEYLDD